MTRPPNSGGQAPGPATEAGPAADSGSDFIRTRIVADRAAGKHGGRVHTRFPPEPNGYLHIGHAKSICLNFGVAAEYGGLCNLRFDDTNPTTEDPEYVEAIQDDVRWLGFDWDERLFYASDYFERLYLLGEKLIEDGKAYVDELSEDEIRAYRGTVTEAGRPSPWRHRPAAESLELFRRMRAGELAAGAAVLRARIDMAAANMKMRDPLLYRIRHAEHYRTGDDWPIYPMYDFAHPLSDAFEGVTHSLCTLEFENNREVYDWVVRETASERSPEHTPEQTPPEQIEFARLNLTYTVLSKRKLKELVDGGHVAGWDDPRMPTLAGLRRRGYTPAAIRDFCDRIGVAKSNSTVDVAQLEHSVRDDLNTQAPRLLCVLRPLQVTITNYPEDRTEELDAPYWPHDVPREGSRPLPFGRTLFIEQDDFAEEPPKGWRRLAPGWEVRLRYAYFIRCDEVVRDASGRVIELLCTYDPATRGGAAPDGRKPKGTLHWVSAERSLPVEVGLYDRLFASEKPGETKEADFLAALNPRSLEILTAARLEQSAAGAAPGSRFQFERQGYFYLDFYLDPGAATGGGRPRFNRIVALRDTWSKAVRPGAELPVAAEPVAAESPGAEKPVPTPAAAQPELTPELLRYRAVLGLTPTTAAALAGDADLAAFFERALAAHPHADRSSRVETVAGWVVNDVQRARKERASEETAGGESGLAGLPFGPAEVAELAALVDSGRVTATAGREVFAELAERGGSPAEIVARRGLEKLDDPEALAAAVAAALAEHPGEVAAYRAGKTQLLGFFIGRVMAATGGAADAGAVRRLLTERL